MAKNTADFQNLDIQIVAISVDPLEDAQRLSEKLKIPFLLLSDPDMDVISAYGVMDKENDTAVPSVFVINQQGNIIWKHVGEAIFLRPTSKKIIQEISAAVKDGQEKGL